MTSAEHGDSFAHALALTSPGLIQCSGIAASSLYSVTCSTTGEVTRFEHALRMNAETPSIIKLSGSYQGLNLAGAATKHVLRFT
ncbi:MAG: hypothetical protein GQ550_08375 [Gammaproteobacteria bacterium]|nr:hypothetical protein [Gammaproteobacteria bacterium]